MIIVDGPMEGTLVCASYVNIPLTGSFRGEIKGLSYKDVQFAEGVLSRSGKGRILLPVSSSETTSPEIVVHGYAAANELLDLIWVTEGVEGEYRPLRDATFAGTSGDAPKFARVLVKVDDFDLGLGKHLIGNAVKVPVVVKGR